METTLIRKNLSFSYPLREHNYAKFRVLKVSLMLKVVLQKLGCVSMNLLLKSIAESVVGNIIKSPGL